MTQARGGERPCFGPLLHPRLLETRGRRRVLAREVVMEMKNLTWCGTECVPHCCSTTSCHWSLLRPRAHQNRLVPVPVQVRVQVQVRVRVRVRVRHVPTGWVDVESEQSRVVVGNAALSAKPGHRQRQA